MSASEHEVSAEVIRLQKLARLKKFDELETAWFSAIENNLFTSQESLAVLEVVAEQKDPKRTESLLWFLITMLAEHKGTSAALEVVKNAAGLTPESESVRTETADLYRKVNADVPEIETLLEMTILRKTSPLHIAIQQMDKFLEMRQVTYVLDKNLSAPGRIVGINSERKTLVALFNNEEKNYDAAAVNRLEPLASDDFRALAAFDHEQLVTLAQDDPAELARLVLKAFGPTLKFREFKAHICPILPTTTWTKWWTAARPQISHSPIIEMSDSAQPTMTLRNRPVAYEYRVRDQFDTADSLEEKLVTIFEYLDTEDSPDATLVDYFCKVLNQYASETSDPITRLSTLACMDRLHKKCPDRVSAPVIDFDFIVSNETNLSNLFTNIYNDQIAKYILTFFREARPEKWYDLYAQILPGASATLCEWIAGELAGEGYRESFTKAIETIVHWPDRCVRAIVWLCKVVYSGKAPEPLSGINRTTLLTGLFTAAQSLKRKSPISDPEQQRRALTQIRNAISADNYGLLRSVIQSAGADYAGFLRDSVPRNLGVGDAIRDEVGKILRETHPELFTKSVPLWEEDAIYTTQTALDKKNEEYAKLVNVDIPHNAKTIGEAAERGDLSENAEFTAALEERDRLTERAGRMRAELKKARIIHHGMADSDSITIGSRVTAKNLSTAEQDEFLFLGPWDAAPEKRIYSYLSPLALAFMGKKVGDIVTHNPDAGEMKWEILEIVPGI